MLNIDINYLTTLCSLVFLVLCVSVIFLLYPELDIYLSSLFFDNSKGFWLKSNPILVQLRLFYHIFIAIMCVIPAFMMIYSRVARNKVTLPIQLWDFMMASLTLGPLLLVNVILKNHWGRARPAQISEFGGAAQFTPPYYITDQCSSNCSFVSGEGSAIATSCILSAMILCAIFPKNRNLIALSMTIIAIIGMTLRIVKGRHFTSDTLLAGLFCSLIIILLYQFFKIPAIRHKLTCENFKHDLKLVSRLFWKN